MRLEKLFVLVAFLISAGVPACGGSVETSTDREAGGGLPEGFCAEACAESVGGTCFPKASCTEYCDANAPEWSPEVGAAFAKCAAENPLCYETLQGCILSELHPPGSKHTVRVSGAGFDAHDGKVLTIWHDPGTSVSFGGEVVLAGGQFSFEWEEPVLATDIGGPLLLLYIDVDGDQECHAAADITASVNPQWNGDLLDPVYTAALAPPLADPDFVCDFPP